MEFIEHPWIKPNTIEKRLYQENIAKTALQGNTLCVLPTGLGKTNIAAIVVANLLEKDMEKKILFLAPTKPLVEQHRKTFERFLRVENERLVVVTGENKPGERWRLYQRADILFSTPQTIMNDLKTGTINLKDFSLLIIDESHRCVGNYAYVYVTKKYVQQSANPLILALTASPGGYRHKIDEIKKKLFIENVEIRTREDPDVLPYVQKLRQDWIVVELPEQLMEIKRYLEKCKNENIRKLMSYGISPMLIKSKTDILKFQEELSKKKVPSRFTILSILAEILKIDHALLLLETQCLYSLGKYFYRLEKKKDESRAGVRLMKDEDFLSAMTLTKELMNKGIEHPKIEKLKKIIENELREDSRIIIFAQMRDTIHRICNLINLIPNCKPVEFIGQTKKSSMGLSQKEQIRIINEFKMGIHNVLVASSVAEEGLDIVETDVVIFYEPVPSAIRRIQRAGRTARTKPGKVIILMSKGTRDESYHWIGYQKEKKMKKILYDMQKKQKEILDFTK